MQNTLREVHCTWFCRKLSSSNPLLSAGYSIYHFSISVSCTDVGFLITCCSLHLLPSDSKHSLSLQFPHLPSATPPLFSMYLLIEFLVVYCQIICSWYSNSYLVSKATFVSCSDMTRKVLWLKSATIKVVECKKVNCRAVRQELAPLSAATTWGHRQTLPSYFQQNPCEQL